MSFFGFQSLFHRCLALSFFGFSGRLASCGFGLRQPLGRTRRSPSLAPLVPERA